MDVPSFLLFSLLLYFFGFWPSIDGIGTGLLPSPEISQVEVEFPCALDLPNGYHTVLIGCVTYGFVRLRMLNVCSIVSFPLLLLYRVMQPRGSAPQEGDNVMARWHVTYPEPGNTCCTYSRLTTRLRSLVMIIPLYYSTILISMFATVCTNIPSYEAIHRHMPLHKTTKK